MNAISSGGNRMQVQEIRWHLEADVVVIGYGAAGAVAAITAHDGGSQVLVLEKQGPDDFITNSVMSGGSFICPNDILEARRYMEALYKVSGDLYWTEPEVLHVWAEYASENKRWFESMGGSTQLRRHGGEHPLPGTESIDVYGVAGNGPGLMRPLYKQIEGRGIRVIHNTQAVQLLVNSSGEVLGVQARQLLNPNETIAVLARRGVILTTGGFEFDEQMKLQFLKVYPTYFMGSPANTGDGIRLAVGVGAELWHMNCCSARYAMKFPEFPVAFTPVLAGKGGSAVGHGNAAGGLASSSIPPAVSPGYVVVDRSGKRYTKETFKGHTLYYELTGFDSHKLFHPRIPSYWIFDQKRMNNGPLARQLPAGLVHPRLYHWSDDNRKELERGWIIQGDSVKDLATKIGVDPQVLMDTVRNYNLYCKQGEDLECDREPMTLVALDTAPYYAVKLWPGGPNTQGGPRRNRKAQVMRADGTPVPRLYSAGELGSIYGMLYPVGGGNLAECIAFGRIAGDNVSRHCSL
jgi:succinate dehydrogenase/fumarate reductase flavoprotein subunit